MYVNKRVTFWVTLLLFGVNWIKKLFLGLRSPKKRSFLNVNEYFSGKRNNKRAFLVSPIFVLYNMFVPTVMWILKLSFTVLW